MLNVVEIISGRALWSKSTKAIKHLDCSVRKADQETSVSHEQEVQPPKHKRYWKTVEPNCFICGKEESVDDRYDSYEYSSFIEDKSQFCICRSCLQRGDAFETYREAFLNKIKRKRIL